MFLYATKHYGRGEDSNDKNKVIKYYKKVIEIVLESRKVDLREAGRYISNINQNH